MSIEKIEKGETTEISTIDPDARLIATNNNGINVCYNAEDLIECEKENITTYVSKQVFSNATGEAEFYIDKFKYDKEENVYICPKGQKLFSRRQKPISFPKYTMKFGNIILYAT